MDEQHVLNALESQTTSEGLNAATSHKDICQATSTIGRYLDDLNNPMACT
jgi:hypothetical protein